MYVYGGMDLDTTYDDFWALDVVDQRWTQLATYRETTGAGVERRSTRTDRDKGRDEKVRNMRLAGHTMTVNTDAETMVIIGGFSPGEGFNQRVLEYDLERNEWKRWKINK